MKTLEVMVNGTDLTVPYDNVRGRYLFRVYGREFTLQKVRGSKAFDLMLDGKVLASVNKIKTVWAVESKKLAQPVFADVTVQWTATPVVAAVRAIAQMRNSL